MAPSGSVLPALRSAGLLLVVGLLAAGCGSSKSVSVEGTSDQPNRTDPEVTAELRSAADEWEGVPQKWGGTSKQGVDCSGLVQSVYQSRFQLSLPRTTDQQVQTGTKVSRSTLRPGDLVFFRHGRKQYHVGIYVTDGEFLHTSTSEGVTVSALDNPYWTERWWQARRLLDLSGESTQSAADTTRQAASGDSVSW